MDLDTLPPHPAYCKPTPCQVQLSIVVSSDYCKAIPDESLRQSGESYIALDGPQCNRDG